MRITDVQVIVWEWRDIPPTRYTLKVRSAGSRSTHMALVKIITDEGIEGHAFLGSALSALGNDAKLIIDPNFKEYQMKNNVVGINETLSHSVTY